MGLSQLLIAADKHEKLKRKMRLNSPMKILRDHIIKERRMSIPYASGLLGIFWEGLDQDARITPDLAARVSKVFGSSPEQWLNMQAEYDKDQAKEIFKTLNLKPFKS